MKRILLSALVIATFASCSKSEVSEAPDFTPVPENEIRFSSSVATRAAFNGTSEIQGLQFLRADGTQPVNDDFSDKMPISGVRASDGSIIFNNPQYYLNDNSPAWFTSYYPFGPLVDGVVTWTVDGKTDIMTSKATVNAGTKDNHEPHATLAYQHELCQVEIVCSAVQADAGQGETFTDEDVRNYWGRIKRITLKNTPQYMTCNLRGMNTAIVASPLQDVDLLAADYEGALAAFDVPAAGNTTTNAAGMFAPVASTYFQLEIETEKQSIPRIVTVQFDNGGTFLKGKRHKINLGFSNAPNEDDVLIVLGSTIDEWQEGTTGSGTVK